VQPGLDRADIRLDPVHSGYRGVEIEKNRGTGAVFAENPNGGGKRRECLGEVPFISLWIGLPGVLGKPDLGLTRENRSKGRPRFGWRA